jgi:squalene-associated FAD-dependent desaturase
MAAMRRQNFRLSQDLSATTLLQQHGQIGRLRSFLWEPLCVAALNTPLDLSSAQIFLNVLRDSLAGSRQDCDMLLPLTDLTRLFPDHAAAFIERNGGQLLRSQTVLAIRREATGLVVETRQGTQHFDQVISAVPPQRLAALTAELPELAAAVAQVGRFGYQPIYTAFLQYPAGTRLPYPMLGLHGGATQWVFDHGQLRDEPGLICAVISAAGPHQALSHDELAHQVDSELRAAFPTLASPQWHKVIAEKRATFSCIPGLERPTQATPLSNFFLAGDYTAGDYPATLEGAVRSGVKCAQLILDRP